MWVLPCTQSNHCPRSLSHLRLFPATKWKKALFQVGYCPSIPSNTDGSWRHCGDSCNHTLRCLGVLKIALWSSQLSPVNPTFHWPSFQGVRNLLLLHRWSPYCQLKSGRSQALFTQVFLRLDQYRITANPEKCNFGQTEINFLGHRIYEHGISSLPEKTQSIVD